MQKNKIKNFKNFSNFEPKTNKINNSKFKKEKKYIKKSINNEFYNSKNNFRNKKNLNFDEVNFNNNKNKEINKFKKKGEFFDNHIDGNKSQDFIYGRKVILESFNSNISINKLYIAKSSKGSVINKIISLCKQKNIIFSFLDKKILDKKFGEGNQGIVAFTSPKEYISLSDFLEKQKENEKNYIAILDNIQDPHNVGAIIRSAFVFGFNAIVLPSRNSCLINSTVLKASSGATNKIDIVKVGNLNQTITTLKENDFLILASDITKKESKMFSLDALRNITDKNVCVILGSEGEGIRESVKKMSDYCINIPMKNKFDSLNVSCAASIIFYELSKNL